MRPEVLLVFFSLVFSYLLVCCSAQRCSAKKHCPGGECCSQYGYCGLSRAYCCKGCVADCGQIDCASAGNGDELSKIISREMFNELLKPRNDEECPARCFYTYDDFIEAAKAFPAFGNTGNDTMSKREIAAFFAQTRHVTTGGTPSFKSAIGFWMTPQSPKPSCHDVILDLWEPNQNDINEGRLPGFGLTTNIINGDLECGHGTDSRVEDRVGYFKHFCSLFGIKPGDNLDCYTQRPYGHYLQMLKSMRSIF